MNEVNLTIVLLMVFGSTILLVYSVSVLWGDRSAEKVRRRLHGTDETAINVTRSHVRSLSRTEKESPFAEMLLGPVRHKKLQRYLEQSGSVIKPEAALLIWAASGLVGLLLAWMFAGAANLFSLLIGLAAGAAVPWLLMSRKRRIRKETLVRQLPDAMDYFARSMRAGHPFASALKAASEEVPQPLSAEFVKTFDELNYGLDFEESLQNMAERINAEEVRFFVTAVLVQKSTGGNLAELLNRLSTLLRERVRARGEVMIQAAEMRGSARILIGLPIVVAGLLQLFNPTYLPVLLTNETGRIILMGQIFLMFTGYLIIKRMINFRI